MGRTTDGRGRPHPPVYARRVDASAAYQIATGDPMEPVAPAIGTGV